MAINWSEVFQTQPSAVTEPTTTVNWEDLYQQTFKKEPEPTVNLNQAYEELTNSLGQGTYKKSLVDLEKDPTFQKVATEFLQAVGESSDDIYEYFRDEDFNIVKGFKRWADATNFSEENKQRYAYLRTAFDNASIGSFGQGMELVKDATIDIASDPTTLLGIIAGIFTGGTATAASFASRKAAAEGFKATLKNFAKSSVVPTPTNLKASGQSFGRLIGATDEASQMLGTATMLGAYEGLLHAGLGDVSRQGTQIATHMRESYNPLQTGAMIPFGTTIGQIAPAGLTGLTKGFGALTTPVVEAGSRVIGLEKYQKKLLNDYKHKIDNYENEDFIRDEVNEANFNYMRKLSRLTGNKLGFLTFARPAAPIRPLAKQSPTAKKLVLELNRDEAQKYFELPELVEGLDFQAEIEFRRSTAKQKLYEILQPIFDVDESIFGREIKLSPDNNEQLLAALNGQKAYGAGAEPIKKEILKAASQIRALDNDIYRDAQEAGLGIQYTKNHFPRYYLREALIEKKDVFVDELIRVGQVAPSIEDMKTNATKEMTIPFTNSEGVTSEKSFITIIDQVTEENRAPLVDRFKQKYPEFISNLERNKANQVYDDMVDLANVDSSYSVQLGGKGNFQSRAFDKISDKFLLDNGFIQSDVILAFEDYINKAIPTIVRTERLGYSLIDFENRFTNQIRDELRYKLDKKGNIIKDEAGQPILRDKPLELSKQDRKLLSDIYMYTTGKGLQGTGFIAEQVVPHLQVLNATAYLPLATVSSLTELALPFARATLPEYAGEAGRPIRELAETMVNQLKDVQSKQVETLRKLGMGDDEIQRELRVFGFAFDQGAKERAAALAGEGIQDTKLFGVGPQLNDIQDLFYKVNFLRDWTASVQRTSFIIGKRIIQNAARDLSKGGLKAKDEIRLREQLVELGINPEDAIKWYQGGQNKYIKATKDMRSYEVMSDGRAYDNFYKKVMVGATRFTNEVILNPVSASAIKPMIYNHPQAKLLFQFLSYPSAFSNTVLKKGIQRATRSLARGDIHNPAKLFSTFGIMTASAMYLNNIRTGGKEFEEKDAQTIFGNGVARTGISGVFDTVDRVAANTQYGGRGIPSVVAKAIGGPTVSDTIEMFQFNRGLIETLSRKVPVVNQLLRTGIAGEEAREIPKLLQQAARELDKKSFEALKDVLETAGLLPEEYTAAPTVRPVRVEPRFQKEKGGLVYNVPNVSTEPDETKMRGLPMSYKDMAGFIIEDEEDRTGFAKGGEIEPTDIGEFKKSVRKFLTSNLLDTTHTEFQNIYQHASTYLDKTQDAIADKNKLELVSKNKIQRNIDSSKIKKDVYLNYNGNNIQDIIADQYFNTDQVGIKLSTSPLIENPYKGKVSIKNFLDLSKFNVNFNIEEVYNNDELIDFLEEKATEKTHEFMNARLELEGLFKDLVRTEKKLLDEDGLSEVDEDIIMASFNNKLFEFIEKIGYDAIKTSNGYLINDINKFFVSSKSRVKKFEGGVIQNQELPEGVPTLEEQGLKPVFVADMVLGGGLHGLRALTTAGKDLLRDVIEKRVAPASVYHGGPENIQRFITPSARHEKEFGKSTNDLQAGIFTTVDKNVAKFYANRMAYAMDKNPSLYEINLPAYKNIVDYLGTKNKILNSNKPTSSLLKNLEKEIKVLEKKTSRKIQATDLQTRKTFDRISVSRKDARSKVYLEQFRDVLLNKHSAKNSTDYVSRMPKTVRDFLQKEGYDFVRTNTDNSTYILLNRPTAFKEIKLTAEDF